MVADNLEDWLRYLEQLHPTPMELGLERVGRVARAMGLDRFDCPLITVGGTNGKGSTVSFLEAVYRAAGYRTAVQVSPHLVRFNERIRLDGTEAEDADILRALAAVETGRGDTSLTYFEYTVLAAVWLYREMQPDVVILEVGLGGRLDVSNLWDADAVVVTNVSLDHQRWLGDDRESIGFEKAHTARAGRTAVCADADPPERLRAHWREVGARAAFLGEDFFVERSHNGWVWRDGAAQLSLPAPALTGDFQFANAAAAVAVIQSLQDRLPVPQDSMAAGIASATNTGRMQRHRHAGATVLLDVAHNGAAAQALAVSLAQAKRDAGGRVVAVAAVMADKDLDAILAPLIDGIDGWHLGELTIERALAAASFSDQLRVRGVQDVQCYASVPAALDAAVNAADPADTVVVFGSFYTVAAVLASSGNVD